MHGTEKNYFYVKYWKVEWTKLFYKQYLQLIVNITINNFTNCFDREMNETSLKIKVSYIQMKRLKLNLSDKNASKIKYS